MRMRYLASVTALVLVVSGCSTVRAILGLPNTGEPSVELRSAEARWLLIKNPRFGDVPSEPEYVWVEEDKVPTTFTTLIRGKGALIAPPEVVARYGAPPGGGRISPRQGVPYQTGAPAARAPEPGRTGPAPAASGSAAPAVELPRRGLVLYVDTTRIVIDLTAADGLRPGALVSLRRDKLPIVHPVTGELLGELDEEIGTARITETRDKFSVAEIEKVSAGTTIPVRDRVVPK
ncbi:MAG TPA: hypothetical protein VLI67_06700 [Vicinamibacteria bacterium]|nr:hypothetical protein [Vicinamibacteria bacterium]